MNGVGESEGRKRGGGGGGEGGGGNTPIFDENKGGLGTKRERGRFHLLSEHQGWRHGVNKLLTGVWRLS